MKVLVVTDDQVGPVMAGSGLRAWELAKGVAAAGHEVRMVGGPGSRQPDGHGPRVMSGVGWRWPDAVIGAPWSLPPRAFVGGHTLIIDGVTPLLAELQALPASPGVQRRRRTAAARLPLVAARADAVLAAGSVQKRWWRVVMHRRPETPILDVPFGIPEADPPSDVSEISGVPRSWAVVLWWGGVWPWLDLETLLAARARLGNANVSVVVPTAPRPGTATSPCTVDMLDAAMSRHRLRRPQVTALEEWVPYAERHLVLNRAGVVAVLHHAGLESDLSFRTRALDGLWAGVPLLLTEGGEVARVAALRQWGAVVRPSDPVSTAAAIELVLSNREQQRIRSTMQRDREAWRWPTVARPLFEYLKRIPEIPHRGLVSAWLASAITLIRRSKGAPL